MALSFSLNVSFRARTRGRDRSHRGLALAFATLSLALLMPSTTFAASGDVMFARMSGASGVDTFTSVSSYGSAVFAAGYNGRNAVLRRYNRSGQPVWSRVVIGLNNSWSAVLGLAADESGVYLAGYVGSTDKPGNPSHQDGYAFIARYAYDGTVQWNWSIDVPGARVATAIATYGQFVYVVGGVDETNAYLGPEAGFVRKYTRAGVNVWTRDLHVTSAGPTIVQLPTGVAASSDGVYVTGQGRTTAPGPTQWGVMVHMYSLEGKTRWSDLHQIADHADVAAIAADGTGAYVVTQAWNFDAPDQAYGGFLLKYNPTGFAWSRRVTEASVSAPTGVSLAPSGVYIGGTTTARLLNQRPGTVADPMGDMFVVRYSRSGTPLMTRQYDDPGRRQAATAIDADGYGAYIVGEAVGFAGQTAAGAQDGLLLGVEP